MRVVFLLEDSDPHKWCINIYFGYGFLNPQNELKFTVYGYILQQCYGYSGVVLTGLVSCRMSHRTWARYHIHKIRFTHAPGMPGRFSQTPRFIDPDMHRGTCVTHVPWCIPKSQTSDFFWCRWQGTFSWHSRRMCKLQFYVTGRG